MAQHARLLHPPVNTTLTSSTRILRGHRWMKSARSSANESNYLHVRRLPHAVENDLRILLGSQVLLMVVVIEVHISWVSSSSIPASERWYSSKRKLNPLRHQSSLSNPFICVGVRWELFPSQSYLSVQPAAGYQDSSRIIYVVSVYRLALKCAWSLP